MGRSPELEAVAVGLSLAAALFITALVTARKEVREAMGTLERAIREEQWELAAYILALAALKVAEAVPPETLSTLLELLEEGDDASAG